MNLRSLGVSIAIDDFGNGYSSLSYSKRFGVDRLKIDKAFVQEIGSDEQSEALTLAVVPMASALNFDIIAEDVETEEQRDFSLARACGDGVTARDCIRCVRRRSARKRRSTSLSGSWAI